MTAKKKKKETEGGDSLFVKKGVVSDDFFFPFQLFLGFSLLDKEQAVDLYKSPTKLAALFFVNA